MDGLSGIDAQRRGERKKSDSVMVKLKRRDAEEDVNSSPRMDTNADRGGGGRCAALACGGPTERGGGLDPAAASHVAKEGAGGGENGEAGGVAVFTDFSGIVDEHDRVLLGGYPAPFRKLLGLEASEWAVPASDAVTIPC